MKIAITEIETKKGQITRAKWDIVQDRPYPTIETALGSLKWRNAEGLLPERGGEADGMGEKYTARVLKADFDPATAKNDWTDYAGHDENTGIMFRGRNMGEIRAEISSGYVYFKGGYNNNLTLGERDLLKAQAAPALIAYCKAHAAELKAEAIAGLRDGTAEKIADAREKLDKIEAEMQAAITAAE